MTNPTTPSPREAIARTGGLPACPFVLTDPCASADEFDEDGSPVWYVEVQSHGGYAVVATIWGGSPEQATQRGEQVIAAWTPPSHTNPAIREAMTKAARAAVGDTVGAHPWHYIDVTIDAILALTTPAGMDEAREALERIADGDEPRPLGTSYFPDKRPSKHDQCAHGIWMYETCGNCIMIFAREALSKGSVRQ